MPLPELHAQLRLVLVTDGLGDASRLEQVVLAAVRGGVRCVQVREPRWSARVLGQTCERLMPILDAAGGFLFVSDRVDVAAARLAHGAQVGHRSLVPALARRVLGPGCVLGCSTHDAEELRDAAAADADFALLSPVWPTTSKPDAAFLGVPRAGALTAAATIPVVWLGGVSIVTLPTVESLQPAQRPVGFAVRSAIMSADDPEGATRELLAAVAATDQSRRAP